MRRRTGPWWLAQVSAAIAGSLFASGAKGESAYFSIEGNFSSSSGAAEYFDVTLPAVGGGNPLMLKTMAYSGGKNAAGQVVAAGGIDSVLTWYTRPGNVPIAYNDDSYVKGTCDSLLAYNAPMGWGCLLDNQSAGTYSLRLSNYGTSIGDGHWATDIVNWATGVNTTVTAMSGSSSTISSLVFGASGGASGTVSISGSSLAIGSGGMVMNSGGTLAVSSGSVNVQGILVNSGKISVGSGGILRASGGMNSSGTIDMGGTMIVDYTAASPVDGIREMICRGYDDGAWDGSGIASSRAAADVEHNTAVGYAEASDLGLDGGGSFDGQTIGNQAVIVKYTYCGDSNLDGRVTTDDFFALVAGLNGEGSGWAYGDYNYDGEITTDDLFIFVAGFNAGGQPLSELETAAMSDANLSVAEKSAMLASVPEPEVLAMLPMMGIGMMARRRRSRQTTSTESPVR